MLVMVYVPTHWGLKRFLARPNDVEGWEEPEGMSSGS